ncbi:LCP family protein [Cryobacterium zhongshanensis]|uniref:LCP family protein n=1 Tax=Cryobacterium zhongshanensis TaxID=2928153 RepID=A0AA41QSQ9_9MICO|nr:LCP family protein [Cryobacterium zhongshanensis]MCI4656987.1 LCP family protein [Cryobacterium zhongshanensis]
MTNHRPEGRADARRHARAATLIRHRRRPSRSHTMLTLIKALSIALAVVLVSGASVAAIAVTQFATKVSANAVDISNGATDAPAIPQLGSFEGGFNVLVVGVDNSLTQSAAYGDRTGTLNDVNILLHVSADHKSAVVISIPRDLVVSQPACTDPDTGKVSKAVSSSAMNASFGRGGLGCVVSTVAALTGLTIPYAGLISFEGTVAMADAVGGVPICLNDAIKDPYTGLDLPAGTSVVSGTAALSYLRSRHGVGDGSDLSRISSQQAYMSSLMRVMKSSATLTDVSKLSALATAAGTNLKLSTSLANIPTMVGMALALKDIDLNQLVFVQYPSATDPDNLAKLVPSTALAKKLFAAVTADQSFTLDAKSLGNSAELDPTATPAATPAATSTPTPTPTAPATDAATGTPTPAATDAAAPVEIAGLRGQTASQQTCSIAYNY